MSRFTQQISSRSRAFTALAALGVLTTAAWLASPAVATAAQPANDVPQAIVYYSSHDLATDQGTRALYERIVTAAQTVCPGWDSRNLDEVAASRQCQREAVAQAIGQIGSARLAAVHARGVARRG